MLYGVPASIHKNLSYLSLSSLSMPEAAAQEVERVPEAAAPQEVQVPQEAVPQEAQVPQEAGDRDGEEVAVPVLTPLESQLPDTSI